MRKLLLYVLLLLLPTTTFAGSDTEQLRQKLDKLLAHRNSLINAKNKDIKRLKRYLTTNGNALTIFKPTNNSMKSIMCSSLTLQ